MTEADRDRILQLIAYVKMAYHADYKRYAQISSELVKAFELCNPVIKSLDNVRREYYCADCGAFQPATESYPDIVCPKCRLVLLTFREV